MSLRETINNNSAVVTIATVALLVIALGFTIKGMFGGGTIGRSSGDPQYWFFDEQTETFFAGPATSMAPIKAPSGGEGVQAFVFTCEKNCGAKDLEGKTLDEIKSMDMFVGYFMKLSERGQKEMQKFKNDPNGNMMMMGMEMASMHNLVRSPDRKKWYSMNGTKGAEVSRSVYRNKCPNGNRPRHCFPGQD